MHAHGMPIVKLSEMTPGEEGDLFVLLAEKEKATTREGKPFYKVSFCDDRREVKMPVWNDSPFFQECEINWKPGTYYKLRAGLRETTYGPQLELRRIREANEEDRADGFDPNDCRPSSRFSPDVMYDELLDLAKKQLGKGKLLNLVTRLFKDHRQALLDSAAARRHHHAYFGGLLEHTLSVTRTAIHLAEKYLEMYPDLDPPLQKTLVVAGAILHDIGKVRELESGITSARYTPEGELIGHLILGRDMVRETAMAVELEDEIRLRLEHLLLAHQRLPEWGSPKPPMTPEALLVHYADDCDAKFNMYANIYLEDTSGEPLTRGKNLLGHPLFRGENAPPA